MATSGGFAEPLVEVVPGEQVTCALVIRNGSPIVEEYLLTVGGEVAGWTTVDRNRVSIYPDTEQPVMLTFAPPRRNGPPAGDVPYKVQVTPVEQPAEQVVFEGLLRVLPFTDLTAEVVPRTSTSSVWGGAHEVAVDNRGNTAVEIGVHGTDPDRRIVVEPKPGQLAVGPGEAAFVKVRARPARLQLTGQPVARPYQIILTPDTAPPLALDSTMVQRALIPPGTVRTLAGLIALVMLGTALWIGLVRRAATSAAQKVVQQEVVPVAEKAEAARQAAEKAVDAVEGTPRRAPAPRAASASPTAPTGPGGIPPGATLFTQRLETSSEAGRSARDEYQVPRNTTLIVTFVDLQNPRGAHGPMELIVDDDTLFTEEQAYYRNDVRYFPTPIQVSSGQRVRMNATCASPGPPPPGATGAPRCLSYVLLGGYLLKASPRPS
ncbi:MAG TPA: hypothetical protein VES42_23880 [Pilimelia sp.]|nr:hypothetical protein [Pilimelia sp.]